MAAKHSRHSAKERKEPYPHLIHQRTPRHLCEAGLTIIESGDGVRITDSTGKSYLDFVSGVTRAVNIGYGRKELAEVVYDQMCKLSYFTPMHYTNEVAIKLSNLLHSIVPGSLEHFSFVSDGSEAIEAAIKLAKHYHYAKGEKQRYKVLARRGSFHGPTGQVMMN